MWLYIKWHHSAFTNIRPNSQQLTYLKGAKYFMTKIYASNAFNRAIYYQKLKIYLEVVKFDNKPL